jgi:hypothetical protein
MKNYYRSQRTFPDLLNRSIRATLAVTIARAFAQEDLLILAKGRNVRSRTQHLLHFLANRFKSALSVVGYFRPQWQPRFAESENTDFIGGVYES